MSSNTQQEKNYDLGNKIRNFRLRAGLSQFKLEELINASPGSISRIENCEVNPTKETLIKISNVLNLSASDSASLLGFDLYSELIDIINLSTDINSFDLDELMRTTAVLLVKKLGLTDMALFIIKGSNLCAHSMAETKQVERIRKILPKAFNKIEISLTDTKSRHNIMVRSIKEGAEMVTNDLYDLAFPVLSKSATSAIVKLSSFKSALVIPLMNEGKDIGVLAITKNHEDDFENDREILRAFARNIAKTLKNMEKYQKLLLEIDNLKHRI